LEGGPRTIAGSWANPLQHASKKIYSDPLKREPKRRADAPRNARSNRADKQSE